MSIDTMGYRSPRSRKSVLHIVFLRSCFEVRRVDT